MLRGQHLPFEDAAGDLQLVVLLGELHEDLRHRDRILSGRDEPGRPGEQLFQLLERGVLQRAPRERILRDAVGAADLLQLAS